MPARLADRDLTLEARTVADAARAQAAVEHGAESMPEGFAALARLLLRAEGVALSFIEGVTAQVVDIVLAEADDSGTPSAAAWVSANLAAVLLTGPIVASELAIPLKSANAALGEFVGAGVLLEHGTEQPSGRGRPSRLYTSVELLGLTGSNHCGPEPRERLGGFSSVIRRRSRRSFFHYPVSQRFFLPHRGEGAGPCWNS